MNTKPMLLGPSARERHIAHAISYAEAGTSRPQKLFIRAMETATGRARLIKHVRGCQSDLDAGQDFWRVMLDRYRLPLDLTRGNLDAFPSTGPLVVIANHPFGVLDGLILGRLLSAVRPTGFKILAHDVFSQAEPLKNVILPINFNGTKAAQAQNIATRISAIRHLEDGGAVGIFPGGTVSTSSQPFGRPADPVWRNFTAKLVARSGATVVPLFFEGHNSRFFQIASHLNYTLRMSLLMREFRVKTGRPVRMAIGKAISPAELAQFRAKPKEMMDFLRAATYQLASEPIDRDLLGYEFERAYKR
jgi:putative hemolysin